MKLYKMTIIIMSMLLLIIAVYAVLNNPDSDLDHDGDVDGADLTIFASVFGKNVENGDFVLGDNSNADRADLDDDGDVDGADLTIFASDFGKRVEDIIDIIKINSTLTIATLRDYYNLYETVELTDPPSLTGFATSIEPGAEKKETELVLSPYGEALIEREIEESDGFIIQFKKKPLLAKEIELKNKIEKTKEKSTDYEKKAAEARLALIRTYNSWRASTLREKSEDIQLNLPTKLNKHKEKISLEHEMALKDISKKVSSITGYAVAEPIDFTKKTMAEYTDVFNGIVLDISEEEANEIKKSLYVKEVYPNYKVHAFLSESVPVIKADKAYEYFGLDGEGITIAVTDTGIDPTHKSLDDLDDDPSTDDPKIIAFKDFVNFRIDPYDDQGHGTHVAGIAAGTGGNSQYKGVAPKANLVGVKVLDKGGSGTFSQVMAGIEWTVQNKNRYNIDVISMSLGADINSDGTTPIEQAADLAVDSGINFVVAAGNAGPFSNTVGIPASAKKVIAVGAVDNNMEIAYFSSRGPTKDRRIKPEVVAPGVDICSAQWDDKWQWIECLDPDFVHISGTSMATPHVAGVAALIKEANSTLTPVEIRELLMNTSIDKGDIGPDNTYGWGVVDTLEALIKIKPPEHDIAIYDLNTPKWTELNNPLQINITLRNNGLNNETNVNVTLLVDNIQQDGIIIGSITSGSSLPISFSFTPDEVKTYYVAVIVEQLDREDIISNNRITDEVRAISVKGTIKAVVVDSWGNDMSQYTIFDELNENWYLYGDYILDIDYTTLNKEDITYGDIADTNADVLILSDAWDDGSWTRYNWQYTDDEINAIKQYVEEGHGIVGTSGTLSTDRVQNNMKLAPLFGLDENSAASWADYFDSIFDILIPNNTILLNKIQDPYISGRSMITTIDLAVDSTLPTTIVARSVDDMAFVSAYKPLQGASVYFTHIVESDIRGNDADKQFFYNSLAWTKLSSAQQEHDIAAYNLKLSGKIRLNKQIHINATIRNNGLNNETNVNVTLLVDNIQQDSIIIGSITSGSSLPISFLFTPNEVKTYDITVVVKQVAGENIILNNYLGAKVLVPGASFNDVYYDYGIDIDGDGLYNYLALDIGIDVVKQGFYNAQLELFSSFGAGVKITEGQNYTSLEQGTHNITVLLDGLKLRKFGLNGPYKVKNLNLYNDRNKKIDSREEPYTTYAYSYDQFQSNSDIEVSRFSVPYRGIVNQTVEITAEIENIGTEIARDVTAVLYESITEEEFRLIKIISLGNLSVGIPKEINFTFTPNEIGYKRLKLIVNSTDDYNPNNNIRYNSMYVIPDAPDVTAYIEWINKLVVNQSATIRAEIRNIGVQTAENVTAELYERRMINGREQFNLIDSINIGSLAADEERDIQFEWTPTEIGYKRLKLIVNSTDDGNLENNIYHTSINVVPDVPDVTAHIEWINKLIVNQSANITAEVRNEGTQAAENVTAKLYETKWENRVEVLNLIGTVQVGNLSADNREEILFSWTPTEIGDKELKLVVNSTDDGNLENNIAYTGVNVVPNAPDVKGRIYWQRLIVNESNKIEVSVENIGVKKAQNITANLYKVQGTGQEENLTLIGTRNIETLDVDEEREIEFDYLPTEIGYIDLKLIVNCTDDGNPNNNDYSGSIEVIANAPDVIADLEWIRNNIVINKENVIIAEVRNIGAKKAEDVIARLYEIRLEDGEEISHLIDTITIGSLNVNDERILEFNYTPTEIDQYTLRLVVNCTDDSNPNNNIDNTGINVVSRSMINNIGTTNITGYLFMKVQKRVGERIDGTLEEDMTRTYSLGGFYYEVTVLDIIDALQAVNFSVNGEKTRLLSEGDSYVISDGTPIGVISIQINEDAPDIVEFYLGEIEWTDYLVIINETTQRTIHPKGYLALDTIWADSGYFTAREQGVFRVYASFRDENKNIIQSYDGTYLSDAYEFRVW